MAELVERVAALEVEVKRQGKDIETQGGTLDHLVNTLDTELTPRVDRHERELKEAGETLKDVAEYVTSQRGAWQFIQRAGIVIAGVAGAWTLGAKLWEYFSR